MVRSPRSEKRVMSPLKFLVPSRSDSELGSSEIRGNSFLDQAVLSDPLIKLGSPHQVDLHDITSVRTFMSPHSSD